MAPAYRWEGENDAIILSRNELLLADFTPTSTSRPAASPLWVHCLGRWQFPCQMSRKASSCPQNILFLQPTIDSIPSSSFLYFNMYAQTRGNDKVVWIGTSGLDRQRHEFDILTGNFTVRGE